MTDKQKKARQRNWELFQVKGRIALWDHTCGDYGIPFDKKETYTQIMMKVNLKFGYPEDFGIDLFTGD